MGALMTLPDIDISLDMHAISQFLCLNYIPGEHTFLKKIKKFPPGKWCLYSPFSKKEGYYWSISENSHITEKRNLDINSYIPNLQTLIDQSIKIVLRSDVPVTLFLSGGIDSSIVAESAVRQGGVKNAYCLDFKENSFSEWSNASFVAKKLGIELHRVILTPNKLENFIDIMDRSGEPLGDSSAFAVWGLSEEVSKDYKVILSGDGADELFAGYLTYKATRLHSSLITKLPFIFRSLLSNLSKKIPSSSTKVPLSYKLARFLRASNLSSAEAHFTWNGSFLPSDVRKILSCDFPSEQVLKLLVKECEIEDNPNLRTLQKTDILNYLANDILVKVDRMTMGYGLEARAPFLDQRIFDFSQTIPEQLRISKTGKGKFILRMLAMQLYGPQIALAKKQGFSIPIHQWLRGPGRYIVEDLLSKTTMKHTGFLNTEAITEIKEQHMKGKAQFGFELWGLMTFLSWYKTWIQERTFLKQRAPISEEIIL